mmetsp:Transcript_28049/g.66618  ORF Transcript_28049/g.66618 Transcript_28049/m.66618 type:complete len:219 (+) Transcript_28049:909-1565(+)
MPVLLHLQQRRPVLLLGQLHVGLVLSLLVLEWAVEEEDPGLLDAPPHAPRRDDVLLEHDTLEHAAVLDLPAGELLHLGVLLDVDLLPAAREQVGHAGHGVEREVRHERPVSARELGADAAQHDFHHLVPVVDVQRERKAVDDLDGILQGRVVPPHDDRGVEVPLEEGLSGVEHLAGEDDDRGGAVSDLLVLRAAELDDRLRRWMGHINLTQDRVAIVG